jgi:hypothetical protein
MNNKAEYGFRWAFAANGGRPMPAPEPMLIATGEAFNVTGGAQGVNLRQGDLVIKLSTGGVTLNPGAETTPTIPYGVVQAFPNGYYDSTTGVMKRSRFYPSGTSWGTNLERQGIVMVVPIRAGVWEVDCDDATTATTEAAYQAFIGENVDFINCGASGELYANPRLDISSHGTTSTLGFRFVGVSPTRMNRDFSGSYVKMLVVPNEIQLERAGVTGV